MCTCAYVCIYVHICTCGYMIRSSQVRRHRCTCVHVEVQRRRDMHACTTPLPCPALSEEQERGARATHSPTPTHLHTQHQHSPVSFGVSPTDDSSSFLSSNSAIIRQHPLPRALSALLRTVHNAEDSSALYALLLFHFEQQPALLTRLHAWMERACSRHEPLAVTLRKAEERLLLLGEEEGGGRRKHIV